MRLLMIGAAALVLASCGKQNVAATNDANSVYSDAAETINSMHNVADYLANSDTAEYNAAAEESAQRLEEDVMRESGITQEDLDRLHGTNDSQ